jgi:hypothetical protein
LCSSLSFTSFMCVFFIIMQLRSSYRSACSHPSLHGKARNFQATISDCAWSGLTRTDHFQVC